MCFGGKLEELGELIIALRVCGRKNRNERKRTGMRNSESFSSRTESKTTKTPYLRGEARVLHHGGGAAGVWLRGAVAAPLGGHARVRLGRGAPLHGPGRVGARQPHVGVPGPVVGRGLAVGVLGQLLHLHLELGQRALPLLLSGPPREAPRGALRPRARVVGVAGVVGVVGLVGEHLHPAWLMSWHFLHDQRACGKQAGQSVSSSVLCQVRCACASDYYYGFFTEINVGGPEAGATLEAHAALGDVRGAALRPHEVLDLTQDLQGDESHVHIHMRYCI